MDERTPSAAPNRDKPHSDSAAEPINGTTPTPSGSLDADPPADTGVVSVQIPAANARAQVVRTGPGRLALGVRAAAAIGGFVPLLLMLFDTFADRLSANPIEDLTQRTGDTAVVMLLLTLSVTPVRRLLGRVGATAWAIAIQPLRRTFGLFAALYAGLHFLVFLVLDYGFRIGLILSEFPQKPFILVGAAALAILITLTVTSTRGWKRRLGPWWRRLHRLVYVAGLLVLLHYVWAIKAATTTDIVLLALLLALLTLRLFTLSGDEPTI